MYDSKMDLYDSHIMPYMRYDTYKMDVQPNYGDFVNVR